MTRDAPLNLRLLGPFMLMEGLGPIALQPGTQRLLAHLALSTTPVPRPLTAARLWPDRSESRAGANLRTALWRLVRADAGLVVISGTALALGPAVDVDLAAAIRRARHLQASPGTIDDLELEIWPFAQDLLTDWYDDWVLVERERFRQVRIHALEALSSELAARGRLAEAIDAGLAAVAAEPLRETAHLVVMRAHAAEGNYAEMMRQYRLLGELLQTELRLDPSPAVEAFVRAVTCR